MSHPSLQRLESVQIQRRKCKTSCQEAGKGTGRIQCLEEKVEKAFSEEESDQL